MTDFVLDEDIEAAIGRIALTSDGRLLHLGLQRAMLALAPVPDAGALQVFEGGRRFAARLKALMDKSIAEQPSVGPGQPSFERPIVISSRGVSSVARARGAARRVGPSDD